MGKILINMIDVDYDHDGDDGNDDDCDDYNDCEYEMLVKVEI